MSGPNCPDCCSDAEVESKEIVIVLQNCAVTEISGWCCEGCGLVFLREDDFSEQVTKQADN